MERNIEKKSQRKDLDYKNDETFYTKRTISTELQELSNLTPGLNLSDLEDILDTGKDIIDNTVPTSKELRKIIGRKI